MAKIQVKAPKGAIFRLIKHLLGSVKGGISREEAEVLLEDVTVIGENIAGQLVDQIPGGK